MNAQEPSAIPLSQTNSTHPATSSRLWVIRTLYFFFFATYGIYTIYINLYYQSIGMTGTQIGWINTVAPLVGVFSGILWGMLNDRFGRVRLLLMTAVIGSVMAVWGLAAARTFLWLVLIAGVYNLFNSPVPPLLDNINLSILGEERERYGQQRIFGSIGYIITSWGFGLILQRFGLHWIFAGYTLVMVAMLLALLRLPNQPVVLETSFFRGLTELVRQPAWLIFAGSALLLWIASSGMYTFLSIYLKSLGATEGMIGLAWSMGAISETPVMFFSAPLLRRLRPQRMLPVAMLLFGVRMIFYSLISSPGWAIPIGLMHGLTFGFFWVSGVNYANQLAPQALKATSQGLLLTVMSLATMISSPLSGWMYDTLGPAMLFRVYAGLCLAAFILFMVGSRFFKPASARG